MEVAVGFVADRDCEQSVAEGLLGVSGHVRRASGIVVAQIEGDRDLGVDLVGDGRHALQIRPE